MQGEFDLATIRPFWNLNLARTLPLNETLTH